MKWMLDTDTCIAIIKKHPVALRKVRGKSIGQIGLSSITLGELAYGAEKSSRPRDAHGALSEFLLALEIAAFRRSCRDALRGGARLVGASGETCWTTGHGYRESRSRAGCDLGYTQYPRVCAD